MSEKRSSAFRANESAASERDEAIHYFTRALKDPREREAAVAYIDDLIEQYGPIVDGYPSWHPFTKNPAEQRPWQNPETTPQGFVGLDHTIYFRDAFLTAPYSGADRVVESVRARNEGFGGEEISDVLLYNHGTTPVLVTCTGLDKEPDGTISKRCALGLMLTNTIPAWEHAQCGESWKTMRRYILGTPCGSRSSLFVNQETGKALKEVHEMLNRHGLFGPVW